jgi:hypothetical protein
MFPMACFFISLGSFDYFSFLFYNILVKVLLYYFNLEARALGEGILMVPEEPKHLKIDFCPG